MTATAQTETTGRALMPDLIRAFALIGIAVVNVLGFSQPLSQGFYEGGLTDSADRIAFAAMAGLFLMKAYPLFSMMFGAGLEWQMVASERAGADASARYFRRMAALFILGLLHFVFFWVGDILMTYALLGCLLYANRSMSIRTLILTGSGLVLLNAIFLFVMAALMSLAETYAPEEMAAAMGGQIDASQIAALGSGSFLDAALWRLVQLPVLYPSVLMQQGLAVFGFFCFGLAAARSGIIDQPAARICRLARLLFLPAGLAGSTWGALILLDAGSQVSARFMFGSAVIMLFSPLSALGYAGLIALASGMRPGALGRFIARAGSASLSAYLFQSVVLAFVFSAYGLGWFGRMGARDAILTALATALASLAFTGLWRSFFSRGPMETLLRRFTYTGRVWNTPRPG